MTFDGYCSVLVVRRFQRRKQSLGKSVVMLILLTFIASSGIWETIPNLKTVISLTAFALAIVLGVMLAWFKSKRRGIPNAFWMVVVGIVIIGVGATLYKSDELYRVRVTVLSPEQVPVEDANVWSSFGGEPKKVA